MTPWTASLQGPLSMGFSRQEYCHGLQFPSTGHLPDPEIKPTSLSPVLAGGFFITEPPESRDHLSAPTFDLLKLINADILIPVISNQITNQKLDKLLTVKIPLLNTIDTILTEPV